LKLGLPALAWISGYNERVLARDLVASGVLIATMVPQALGFALVAGVPVQVGLYSAILPAVIYALLGTGRTLSVGPVAIVSILTATTINETSSLLKLDPLQVMATLTVIVGISLTLLGLFRFGFIANFLSRPVVSGFISASGVVIAVSQLPAILGISNGGESVPDVLYALIVSDEFVSRESVSLGLLTIAFLVLARLLMIGVMDVLSVAKAVTYSAVKLLPLVALVGASYLGFLLGVEEQGVAVLGAVPSGAPPLSAPTLNPNLWLHLAPPAFLIAVIAYVESISTARKLAANRRERVSPDQELLGLGAANLVSAFSSGLPVAGSLARSLANYDAGARTPLALIFAAWGVG
jgi:SulP family sulfate permease